MRVVREASQKVFEKKINIILFIFLTITFLLIYYLIIERTITLESFLKVNSVFYVILQILLTFINSIFGSLSIIFLVESFKLKRKGNIDLFQTAGSLSLSILSTGCYICGSLIIPIAGLTGFISSLPFAGLEIKLFTLIILMLTIIDLSEKISGICSIKKKNIISFKYEDKKVTVDTMLIWNYKLPILSFIFILFVIISSIFVPKNLVNMSTGYSCPKTVTNI